METLKIILMVLIAIASILTILLVLLNRGKGGGLSDMFGGGMTTSLNSSGMASKNLIRLTVTVILLWVFAIIGYALVMRFSETAVI
ncbi:MAG: preprotein translocase subunit SecG [Rothia sp. (in: high G+C Gram-positive bacteria)]|uniref:preprotein translocase subunit SecG n=1 Tax=unclassified Rothia (in: high G+C Gram-positive bacteria) TaxID=2689056 RepID=UPI0024B928BF|nr:preprotein translocase subunit SecG [Rothia sp. SD9660Na]MDO4820690.1 preprotein translocase subunit SecG [Rothia sp. (in: high G+C Gram-positive bacteria)]WHS49566.1 preprotein translocase subunit SecG [Rothia sp. SD9660Na]